MNITENFYNQIVKDLKDNIIKRYCVYYNNDVDCWFGNNMFYNYEEGFIPATEGFDVKEPKTYINKKLNNWFYLSELQKKLLENEYYYCTPSDEKIKKQNGSYFDVINIKQYCLKYNIDYYSKLHPIFIEKWGYNLYESLEGLFTVDDLEEKFNKLKKENDLLYPSQKEEKKKTRKTNSERSKLTAGLRYDIFRRDNFRCQICGRSAQDEGVILHVDHIIPISKGGKTEWDNLQTLCQDCNLGKSNKIE